jgi:hypothetical protein
MITEQKLTKYEKVEVVKEYVSKIQEYQSKVVEKLENFQNSVREDLTDLKKNTLAEETKRNIDLYHKYNVLWTKEKIHLSTLKGKLDIIESELTDYYRNHSDISSKLRSEQAIEKYVVCHDCYRAIKSLYDTQYVMTQFLENVMIMNKDRAFAIKNMIELLKIELGMIS